MSDRDDLGAFLLGFLVGGLAGATAALLLAPKSGEETRTEIKTKAIELYDKASTSVDTAFEEAEKAAEEARVRFEELSRLTKERADDFQHRGQVILEEQRARLNDTFSKKGGAPNIPMPPADGEVEA